MSSSPAEPKVPTRPLPESAPASRPLARGTQIGRYLVLRTLGRGGMGVVYLADDPQLDRKVAVKVVRQNPALANADSQARLLREAKVAAKLSHPNVVAVYDAGNFAGGVFVAMEYCEGIDMRQWLEEQPRSQHDVLDAFIAAGRGLEAAHAAGLVHRDVKPDNILIGDDGRIRVMDFGLAAEIAAELSEDSGRPSISAASVVQGTPGYIAPEQFAGGLASERADQFAFFVTLYEALYRQRPFAAGNIKQYRAALREGAAGPPADAPRIPMRLRRTLARGLSLTPGERFPAMADVVRELTRQRGARGRRALGASLVVAIGGGVIVGYAPGLGDDEACGFASTEMRAVWGPDAKARVKRAFEAVDTDFSDQAWRSVDNRLDAFAASWTKLRDEVCQATVVRRERSGTQMDLQVNCLDRHLQDAQALVETLAHADAEVVTAAVSAVASLPNVSGCADLTTLSALPPIPKDPADRRRAADLRAAISEAAAQRRSGRFDSAVATLDAQLEPAQQLAYAPILAELYFEAGQAHGALEHHDIAEARLREALVESERAGYDHLRARVWLQLAWELGHEQKRFEAAREALRAADAVIEIAGDDALRHQRTLRQAEIELADSRFDRASELYERLLADATRQVPDHVLLHQLGVSRYGTKTPDESLEPFLQALVLREQLFGRQHPQVAETLVKLARSYTQLDRFDDAARALDRALTIRVDVFGDRSVPVAEVYNRMGVLDYRRGNYGAAREHLEHAVASVRASEHADYDLAPFLSTLGVIDSMLGRYDEATQKHTDALEMLERTVGSVHPRTMLPVLNLGSNHMRAGQYERAIPWLRRARQQLDDGRHWSLGLDLARAQIELGDLEAAETTLRPVASGAPNPNHRLAAARMQAQIQAARGDEAGALDALLADLESYVDSPANQILIAAHRFATAQLLWSTHRDRPRALTLARAALTAYTPLRQNRRPEYEAIESWLATHAPNHPIPPPAPVPVPD